MALTHSLLPADLTIFYFPCTITAIKLLSIMLSIACSALQCRLKLPVSGMLLPRVPLKSNDFHLQRSHPPLSGFYPCCLRTVLLHEFLALDKHSIQYSFQGHTPGLAAKAPTAGRDNSAADCMLSSASGGKQLGGFSPTLHPQLLAFPMLEPGMCSNQLWRVSGIHTGGNARSSVTTSERRSIGAFLRHFRMLAASRVSTASIYLVS